MVAGKDIFKAKSTENVIKQNDDKIDDVFDDKRKVQKTSSNEPGQMVAGGEIFKAKSTKKAVNLNDGLNDGLIDGKRKVQKKPSNESEQMVTGETFIRKVQKTPPFQMVVNWVANWVANEKYRKRHLMSRVK